MSRSTWCLVRRNMIVRPSRAAISATTAALSSRDTSSKWWSIVDTVAVAGDTECVTGLVR